ncbi:hypothetical protein GCM10027062_27280 [Nocardioides hungaricus]
MTESAAALAFLWLGMVLAISFLEAPLKFRAPGVTLRIGLGIGRLVFRALNVVEAILALAMVVFLQLGDPIAAATVVAAVAILALVAQVAAVRPALTRRSDAVLAGEDGPRSHAHLAYVALEVVKVVALVVAGALLLQG